MTLMESMDMVKQYNVVANSNHLQLVNLSLPSHEMSIDLINIKKKKKNEHVFLKCRGFSLEFDRLAPSHS